MLNNRGAGRRLLETLGITLQIVRCMSRRWIEEFCPGLQWLGSSVARLNALLHVRLGRSYQGRERGSLGDAYLNADRSGISVEVVISNLIPDISWDSCALAWAPGNQF